MDGKLSLDEVKLLSDNTDIQIEDDIENTSVLTSSSSLKTIYFHKFLSLNWYLNYILPGIILISITILMYLCRDYAKKILIWIEHQNSWLIFSVFIFMFAIVSFPIAIGYLILMITSGYLFGYIKGFLTVIIGANLGVAIAHNTIKSIQGKLPIHR